jgi:PAS domain S-box-containing protein
MVEADVYVSTSASWVETKNGVKSMAVRDAVLVGSYNDGLVALSVLMAVLASYAALELAGRVTVVRGAPRQLWLAGGAVAMGIGIWSMHYIGMLAFRLPVRIDYHWPTVLLSLLAGIVSSALALFVASQQTIGSLRTWGAGICMGGGIAILHYTSMAAMRLKATCHYSPPIVALSILFAIAATFARSTASPNLSRAVSISALGTAGIAIVVLMVLMVALLVCLVDRLQRQKALLDQLFEQAPEAVTLLDSGHRVLRVNRKFSELFGYAPEDALGHHLCELIVPEESRQEMQRNTYLASNGMRIDAESVCRRKDGSQLQVSLVQVPV